MPLQLLEASFEDLHEMLTVVFAAYLNPLHPFVRLLSPGLGSDSKDVFKKDIQDAAKQFTKVWKSSSTEHSLKVVDTETGEIVGVSRWQICEKSLFPNGPPHVEAEWYPEGSRIREYCTYLMNDRLKRQATRCKLPHIWLNMICTRPEYRRPGIAALMMRWGIARADETNYEMFIEAGSDGLHLYHNFDFVDFDKLSTPRPEGEPDDEWKRLEEEYLFEATWIWRPKQGKLQN